MTGSLSVSLSVCVCTFSPTLLQDSVSRACSKKHILKTITSLAQALLTLSERKMFAVGICKDPRSQSQGTLVHFGNRAFPERLSREPRGTQGTFENRTQCLNSSG